MNSFQPGMWPDFLSDVVVVVVVVVVALSTTAVRDPLDTTMYRPDLPTKVRVPKSGARIFEPDFIEF